MIAVVVVGVLFNTGLSLAVESPLVKHEALAAKLVNQCANVHEKDMVMILGSVRDADLMDAIALQVEKAGAFPLVVLQSEQRRRRYFDIVPEKYDAQEPEFLKHLMNGATVVVLIDDEENPGLFQDVPAKRFTTVNEKYIRAIRITMKEQNTRFVNLGNGLYPTQGLARQFNMTQEDLAHVFWKGLNTDYRQLEKTGIAIKSLLTNGKKLRLTSHNGTDLTCEITRRPIRISDGIISDTEEKLGAPNCTVWLPAGEVYVTPVPGTAEGKVVVERKFFQGQEIEDLVLTFKKGKLVNMSAKSGLTPYKAVYEAAGPGKEDFGYVDIGINPNVQIKPGSKMVAWTAAGMITIGHGGNSWAGGQSDSDFDCAYHLPKATLTVDGKVIVDEGVLKP